MLNDHAWNKDFISKIYIFVQKEKSLEFILCSSAVQEKESFNDHMKKTLTMTDPLTLTLW